MRKFLAVLMAALMLVSAALPVFASEDGDWTTANDGTAVGDAEALGLIITEYMCASKAPNVGIEWDEGTIDQGFQYIELYNKGDKPVDLYNVGIALSDNQTNGGQSVNNWETYHNFQKVMYFEPGNIYQQATDVSSSLSNNEAINPDNATLQPGQLAVVWFWTDVTDQVMDAYKALGANNKSFGTPVQEGSSLTYYKGFRDYYNIPADALVIAVYAGTDGTGSNSPYNVDKVEDNGTAFGDTGDKIEGSDRFRLNWEVSMKFALLDATNGKLKRSTDTLRKFAAFTPADPVMGTQDTYDPAVLCMWDWGVGTGGIALNLGKSTSYVPANISPDLYNYEAKMLLSQAEQANFVGAANYYEIGVVPGFKELAPVSANDDPTPGRMADWQWAMIAPNSDYVAGKLNGATVEAWCAAAIETYCKDATKDIGAGSADDSRDEEGLDYDFTVDRDNLGNNKQNAIWVEDPVEEEEGFPVWALILIIVGGVVLLGAAAVVVIIVIKKKNKPVAADDVAAEGDVEVIDETKDAE